MAHGECESDTGLTLTDTVQTHSNFYKSNFTYSDGLMTVTGRKHNADDIIATVLAVEPMRFIYRGRIAVFSIKVLRDERVCVIAEQRPDCSEEESFQWMSRVLQAVDSIHQVGIYCLALVPPNHLPKTPLG